MTLKAALQGLWPPARGPWRSTRWTRWEGPSPELWRARGPVTPQASGLGTGRKPMSDTPPRTPATHIAEGALSR